MSDWNRVRVMVIVKAAEGILDVRLLALDGQPLPVADPGSHIDVRLPNGLIRQYSVHQYDPSDGSYSIGVGLSEPSRGGSAFIHTHLRVGDLLEISAVRNHFPLERNASTYLFIAGGIGILSLIHISEPTRPY